VAYFKVYSEDFLKILMKQQTISGVSPRTCRIHQSIMPIVIHCNESATTSCLYSPIRPPFMMLIIPGKITHKMWDINK